MCYRIVKHSADKNGIIQYDLRLSIEEDKEQKICVGYCTFKLNKSDKWSNNMVEVTDIYINPNYYDEGLGKKVINEIMLDAYNNNYTHIIINDNHRASVNDISEIENVIKINTKGNLRHLFGKFNK